MHPSSASPPPNEPRATNHEPRATNHEPRATNHEPRATNYEPRATSYPLSIFPESEQRRIATDYVLGHPEVGTAALRVPAAVKRAIAGAEKAMVRSRKRAEKGLCSKEESDAFCEKSKAALKSYLDKQLESGTITPAERKALTW